MSWQASVDRVMQLRRDASLRADNAELIRILQEVEERCQVVVNRDASQVLKGVPSWKQKQPAQKPARFRGGMRTWADKRRQLEKKARAGSEKMQRRTREFEQVLSGEFGTQQPKAEAVPHEEISDVNTAT